MADKRDWLGTSRFSQVREPALDETWGRGLLHQSEHLLQNEQQSQKI